MPGDGGRAGRCRGSSAQIDAVALLDIASGGAAARGPEA